ncbi:hypothetical protein, partial [Mycobacteroides abscessus]|uniref:hypothetical protein n=1 Tax=Mycobacteroides abscessus TaxID=36809 RepID=UPI001A9616E7
TEKPRRNGAGAGGPESGALTRPTRFSGLDKQLVTPRSGGRVHATTAQANHGAQLHNDTPRGAEPARSTTLA